MNVLHLERADMIHQDPILDLTNPPEKVTLHPTSGVKSDFFRKIPPEHIALCRLLAKFGLQHHNYIETWDKIEVEILISPPSLPDSKPKVPEPTVQDGTRRQ